MLRGLPHLTQYAPQPVERRKLLPDPENEPNFYEISQLFPLPDEKTNQIELARSALAQRGIYLSNNTTTVPSPPHNYSTAAVFDHIPSRAVNLNLLSPSILSTVDVARMSVMARIQEIERNLNPLTRSIVPSYYGRTEGIGNLLSTTDLNTLGFRDNYSLLDTNNPLIQNYQNNIAYERFRSSLALTQLIDDQQSRDRLSAYLQYVSSQDDKINNVTNNPFDDQRN